jgi:hypothetical protein
LMCSSSPLTPKQHWPSPPHHAIMTDPCCSKNGKKLGLAFTVPEALRRSGLYPSCCVKNAELRFNFGSSPFRFPPDV